MTYSIVKFELRESLKFMYIWFSGTQTGWSIHSTGHQDSRVFEMCNLLRWKFNILDIFIYARIGFPIFTIVCDQGVH